MITKDSATKLSKTPVSLRDVIKSSLQIPWKTLILVDNSSDNTPEIVKSVCEEFGRECIVIRGGRTRAEARQIAIDFFLQNFSDEWLMFLDDDVILNEGWWEEAKEYIRDPKVGIIWGVARWTGAYEKFNKILFKFLKLSLDDYLIEEFLRRGGTHDTLLRRAAIEDLKIPVELHVYEDGYILRHVLMKGYTYKIVKVGCVHYNPGFIQGILPDLKEIELAAKLAIKYQFDKPSILRLLRTLAGLPLNLYCGYKAFGGLKGIKFGFARWLRKFMFRVYLLKYGLLTKFSRKL